MSHERFLAEVFAHPNDDAPKLVYADWLEERGDKRADFIRLVVEGEPTDEEISQAAELEWSGHYRRTVKSADLPREFWPLFAADCAERVLPLFEAVYPDDDRPRKAIEAARGLGDPQQAADAAGATAKRATDEFSSEEESAMRAGLAAWAAWGAAWAASDSESDWAFAMAEPESEAAGWAATASPNPQ
ncbi:MAG: TIGR02996 domain-containing protein, partial [Planctomycetales bacterium]